MRCYGCGKRETLALYKFCLRLVQSHLSDFYIYIPGIHECIVLLLQTAYSSKNLRLCSCHIINNLRLFHFLKRSDEQFFGDIANVVLQLCRIFLLTSCSCQSELGHHKAIFSLGVRIDPLCSRVGYIKAQVFVGTSWCECVRCPFFVLLSGQWVCRIVLGEGSEQVVCAILFCCAIYLYFIREWPLV